MVTGYVLIDMDGVVADWVGSLLNLVKERLGINYLHKDIRDYNIRHLDLPDEVFTWPAEEGFWYNLEVLPEAKEFMKQIKLVTSDWYFFTATGRSYARAAYEKRQWLRKHFKISYTKVVICDDKPGFIRPGDILLDDKHENVINSIKKGAHGFLIKQPWNESILDPKPVTLLEALESIKKLLKEKENT